VRPTAVATNQSEAAHGPANWPGATTPPAAAEVSGRKVVGRTSLIVAVAIAVAFASMAAAAFVFDHNLSRTLNTTRASLASTQSTLAGTQTDLTNTRSDLNHTTTALGQQKARVRVLESQVSVLQGRLSDAQSLLHASQQVTDQVATVASSLKSCVDDTQLFQTDFTSELSGGFYSSTVTDEANRADAACAQANSDYNALLSELSLASSTAT
jgi:septal ring factor EnvC (AmiA/AmiB activator)